MPADTEASVAGVLTPTLGNTRSDLTDRCIPVGCEARPNSMNFEAQAQFWILAFEAVLG